MEEHFKQNFRSIFVLLRRLGVLLSSNSRNILDNITMLAPSNPTLNKIFNLQSKFSLFHIFSSMQGFHLMILKVYQFGYLTKNLNLCRKCAFYLFSSF
jgi:hypothetical protein